MTKIKEIIDHYVPPICQGSWYEDMMKEYAEYFAKKCLEIAAKEVTFEYEEYYRDGDYYMDIVGIDSDSILNIKLPEHD